MTAAAEPARTPAPDEAAALVAQGLAHLAELAQIGMAFARALGRVPQAAIEAADGGAPESTPELNDAALAFSRVSRAVRMTVGLQAKIVRDRQARSDRFAAAQAARDEEAAAVLEERRATANLRKEMTRFIVQTAIEVEERDEDETEALFEGLDVRLAEIGDGPLDFEEIHVQDAAHAIAKALGVDPGPDWWEEGWGFSPPPTRSGGGGGDERRPAQRNGCDRQRFGDRREERLSEAEAGSNGGGGGDTARSGSGAASAPPRISRTG